MTRHAAVASSSRKDGEEAKLCPMPASAAMPRGSIEFPPPES